ncbi:MAG: hypothetical protein EOP04_22035, partial [Proteobacteria bacterium]
MRTTLFSSKKSNIPTSLAATAKEIINGSSYTKTSVCRALGISRAAIYKSTRKINMAFYRKADDEIYLPVIRQVIEKRPTYGYKRVKALANCVLRSSQRAEINRKRVYRLMKMHGLILPKSGEKRLNREGTGQLMT